MKTRVIARSAGADVVGSLQCEVVDRKPKNEQRMGASGSRDEVNRMKISLKAEGVWCRADDAGTDPLKHFS